MFPRCANPEIYGGDRDCDEDGTDDFGPYNWRNYTYFNSGQCPAGATPDAFGHCEANRPDDLAQLGAPQHCVGNPINPYTGNKYQREQDYAGTGVDPLHFVRHYNSRSGDWTHSYSQQLQLDADPNLVTVHRADGQRHVAVWSNGVWGFNPGVALTLEQNGSTWLLGTANDAVEAYDSAGRLLSVTSRNGHSTTLGYDGNGYLDMVTAFSGRTLDVDMDSNGRLVAITDPAGNTTQYGHNGNGQLTTVTRPDGAVRTYVYNYHNYPKLLTSMYDESGSSTPYAEWTYDTRARATSSSHGGGIADAVTVEYLSDGNVAIENAFGQREVRTAAVVQGIYREVATSGEPTANCPGYAVSATYDGAGQRTAWVDREGNSIAQTYDARGLVLTRTEAVGTAVERQTSFLWHPTYRLPTRIERPGQTVDLAYDASGRMTSRTVTDVATSTARTTTWQYNLLGLVDTMDGPRTDVSDVTSYQYDGNGDLLSVTNAAGHVVTVTARDARGLVTGLVDANGTATTLAYDVRGRLTQRTVVDGHGLAAPAVTTLGYSPAGMIASVTLPDGAVLTYEYDAARRLTAVANADGERIEYTLDLAGNATEELVKASDATLRRAQTRIFDELSRLREIAGNNGQVTSVDYDLNGLPVEVVDGLGHSTQSAYDELGRLVAVTNPLANSTSYTYDARDNLASLTDPIGATTSFTWSGFDELLQEQSPDRGTMAHSYDAAGNRISSSDGNGVQTQYSYDALNRLVAVTHASDPGLDISYSWDASAPDNAGVGQLTGSTDATGSTGYRYDGSGRVLAVNRVVEGVSYSTTHSWDAAGQPASITYPSGRTVTYHRDSQGRLTGVDTTDASGTVAVLSTMTWSPFGPATGWTFGNGIAVSRNYDLDGRPTTYTATRADQSAVQALAFGYDLRNDITALTDNAAASESQTFGYDPMQRLTSASGGYGTLSYSYDANGNRLARTRDATGSSPGAFTETYSYGFGNNRLVQVDSTAAGGSTRVIGHDAAGNTTTDGGATLTYDARNRLASHSAPGHSASYRYNALGQRVSRTEDGVTTHYIYGLQGELLAESDATGTVIREYLYADGERVALVVGPAAGDAEGLYFVHNDHLGTPKVVTDGTGAVAWHGRYLPFGEVEAVVAGMEQVLRFPGQVADGSGRYYNYFRDYHAGLGRYVEGDPIGLGGGLNTYAYAASSPLIHVDPTGEAYLNFGAGLGAAALDLFVQYSLNGGRIECIKLSETAIAFTLGAANPLTVLSSIRTVAKGVRAKRRVEAARTQRKKARVAYRAENNIKKGRRELIAIAGAEVGAFGAGELAIPDKCGCG